MVNWARHDDFVSLRWFNSHVPILILSELATAFRIRDKPAPRQQITVPDIDVSNRVIMHGAVGLERLELARRGSRMLSWSLGQQGPDIVTLGASVVINIAIDHE